ncbi:glycosyltransferase family 4 protein [Exiguobacterium mexicanum]|uniref:glycosyltransferase family 4 protein n=1 Tax=Exiguobacterium mexicanum TaxID=340146 RepID=UPI0037C16A07
MDVEILCGYPFEYLTQKTKIPLTEKLNDSLFIRRLKYSSFEKKIFLGRIFNYFSFTFHCLLNIKYFKNKDICIVYSNPPILTIIPYIAKKIYGTKIIFVSYDVYPEIAINSGILNKSNLIVKIMKAVNRIVYPSFDCVVALSSEMKEFLVRNRNINPNKIEIIPNWKDKIALGSAYNEYNKVSDKPFLISYFGNMGTAQDMETIKLAILGLKNNKNISFLLVGHGNKKEELKKYFEENNSSNVKILDFLHGKELKEKMIDSDVFLVSLEENIKGLAVPSKTYSYLAMGKPIIAIMNGDMEISQELEEYNAGFSIDNFDVQKLIRIIDLLSNDKKLYSSMSQNSQDLYESKYTRVIGTSKYKKIIEEM